jgi:hypothetical protein
MNVPVLRPARAKAITVYPPNVPVPLCVPGSFMLRIGTDWLSRMVQFGQRVRIHGDDRKFTRWTHAAVVAGPDYVIHMADAGVAKMAVNDDVLLRTERAIVEIEADECDRREVVEYAEWVFEHRDRYGWINFVSASIAALTGAKFGFYVDSQLTCSSFVAQALERSSAIFDRNAINITPADLAKYYGADPSVVTSSHSGRGPDMR